MNTNSIAIPQHTQTHKVYTFLWNKLICLLQFSEIGQPLEYVYSQAANAVIR